MPAATELKVLIDAQVSGFTRGLAQAQRELGVLRKEHERTAGAAKLQAIEERNLTRALHEQSRALGVLTLQYTNLRRAMLTLAVRTAVTGMASMVSTISALVNALVMLTSTAAGAGAALGAVGTAGLLAIGQGATVAVLGLNNVAKALTTTGKEHEKALAKLTKPARAFVGELRDMQMAFREIKLLAQEGMFEGLARAAHKSQALLAPFKQVVYDTAKVLGYLGDSLATVAVKRKNDLLAFGERNVVTLRRMGDAAINFGSAFLTVMRAADPLIGHVTAGIKTFSENVDKAATNARKSGGLGSFFFELRRSWDEWTSSIGKTVQIVFNVLRAAAAPAHEMNRAIGGVLSKWKAWTGSDEGQRKMTAFFRSSLKPLGAMAKFLGAFVAAWIRLTSIGNDNAVRFFDLLRTKLLPVLEELATQFNSGFFQAFLNLMGATLDYVHALLPGLKPVGVFLHALTDLLSRIIEQVSKLIDALPDGAKLTTGLGIGALIIGSWGKLKFAISLAVLELRRFLGLTRDINVVGPGMRLLANRGGRAGDEGAIAGGGGGVAAGVAGMAGAAAAVGTVARNVITKETASLATVMRRATRDFGRQFEVSAAVSARKFGETITRSENLQGKVIGTRGPQINEGIVSVGPYRDGRTGRFTGPAGRVPRAGMSQAYGPNTALFTSVSEKGTTTGLGRAAEKSKPVLKGAFAFAAVNGIIGGLASDAKTVSGRLRDVLSTATMGLIPSSDEIRNRVEKGLSQVLKSGSISPAMLQQTGLLKEAGGALSKLNGASIKIDNAQTIAKLRAFVDELRKSGKVSDEFAAAFKADLISVGSAIDGAGGKLHDLSVNQLGKLSALIPDLAGATRAKIVGPVTDVARAFADMEKSGGTSLKNIRDRASKNLAQIKAALINDPKVGAAAAAQNFRLAAAAIQKSMDAGKISTKEGTAAIRSYLISALQEVNPNWNRKQAGLYLQGRDPLTGKNMASPTVGKAGGGFVERLPGTVRGDSVPLNIMAAPGEDVAVFNQHQRKRADKLLGAVGGLKGLFRNVNTPHHHSAPMAAAQGGLFESTAYGPPWDAMNGSGQTATGIRLAPGPTGKPGPYIVAVDPSVVPLHTKLRAWPNPFDYRGAFSAEDTGGAIKGNRLDFLDMIGRAHQNAWGRRMVQVALGGKDLSMPGGGTGTTGSVDGVKVAGQGMVHDLVQASLDKVRDAAQVTLDRAGQEFAPTFDTSGGAGAMPGGDMGDGKGAVTPSARWNPARKPIASWIVPILQWAAGHGWGGSVTSGYRTAAQQEQAAGNYGLQHYPNGAQASNHRRTAYPGGAVDVTAYAQLAAVLKRYPGSPNLVWGGPVMGDYVHFSANGHAQGGFVYAAGGVDIPSRNDGTPSVNTSDAVTGGGSSSSPSKTKKRKKKAPFVGAHGRPNLSKVTGAAKKKRPGRSPKVPKWMEAALKAAGAGEIDKLAPDLKVYDKAIEKLQNYLSYLSSAFNLTEEQAVVTLEDTDQHKDLSAYLATPEGQALAKYVTDPKTGERLYDSLDVVNQHGMTVQGKSVRGIDQAVEELNALLGVHVGPGLDPANPNPAAIMGLMLGELGVIQGKSIPLYMGDAADSAYKVQMYSHYWNMRHDDRETALDTLKDLTRGKSWQDRVATNNARIETLDAYKRKIAKDAVGHRLTQDDKRNRLWADEMMHKLRQENKRLREQQPYPGERPLLKASAKETKAQRERREAENARRRRFNAQLRQDINEQRYVAQQSRVEMDFINGDFHKLDIKTDGGLLGAWRDRWEHDTGTLSDLVDLSDTLQQVSIPGEGIDIAQILKDIGDLRGTTVNYTLPDAGSGSGSGSSELDESKLAAQQAVNDQLTQALRVSESQRLVIEGFTPLLNARFVGAFAHGGKVKETGMALVHANETIIPAPDGPFYNQAAAASRTGPTNVEVHMHGELSGLWRRVDARIDQRAMKVVTERAGRRARVFASAPGGQR